VRTALIHDWLVSIGGGERVLEALLEIFDCPIYTLIQDKKLMKEALPKARHIETSFIQKLPFAAKAFRNYLPLFPLAIEQFDLREFDVVISNSHAVAKGALTSPQQLHICYCMTPMRYAWDMYQPYTEELSGLKKWLVKSTLHKLRNWDINSLSRVDHFACISHYIAKRIKKFYGRDAAVIYPPVDTERFPLHEKKENYYVTVSRLVPYKRVDLIVEAFSKMPDKKLIVIGDGAESGRIRSKASKNVELLGYQNDATVADAIRKAKAFVFAAEEDFGIVPVEAQCTGTPVIAYGRGASLETVVSGKTGLFFEEQTAESIANAISRFEMMSFKPEEIHLHAQQFSIPRFQAEFKAFVTKKWEEFTGN
jgi:glycosyltransferase involved in cell wall biosynthesis